MHVLVRVVVPRAGVPGLLGRDLVDGITGESEGPACAFAPRAWPGKTSGRPFLVEVLEEYSNLRLRHGDPVIRGDGEPCDDDLQLHVTGKVVMVVTGRMEEIRIEDPAIVSVLGLLRFWVADNI